VISQQETSVNGFMGSQHTYQLPSKDKLGLAGPKDVDVAIAPEELEHLDQETLKRKYTETVKGSKPTGRREDLSDLVDEHAQLQAQKRVKKDDTKKRHKDFKF
jgi:hypothetical protein